MRFAMLAALWLAATLAAGQAADDGAGDAGAEGVMTNEMLGELVRRIDPEAAGRPGFWQLRHQEFEALVITDEQANRMRTIVPITSIDAVEPELLRRLMQANFDSALDARYAIAQGRIWAVFVHPLASLSEHEFFSGLAQAFNLAATFGSTYSSGALVFGGGDSAAQQREYYESIMDRAKAI